MRLSVLFCAIAGGVLLANAATARESVRRPPPVYPTKCAPSPGEVGETHKVIVAYEVKRDGLTENIRVRETTDPCFNEIAVAAVRGWLFERASAPTELETTFIFVYEEPTSFEDFDAAPLTRVPPQYPQRCAQSAQTRESVVVEFDVTAEGDTRNIRVVTSTNQCLNNSATRSVAQWKYRPKLVAGEPTARPGVRVMMTFELSDSGRLAPQYRVRGDVRRTLTRIQKELDGGADVEEALEELAAIEAARGDSFTQPELAAFHLVRGKARIRAGDYRGALDDFRLVQTLSGDESLRTLIGQLETAVAAEDAAAASAEAQASAEPES